MAKKKNCVATNKTENKGPAPLPRSKTSPKGNQNTLTSAGTPAKARGKRGKQPQKQPPPSSPSFSLPTSLFNRRDTLHTVDTINNAARTVAFYQPINTIAAQDPMQLNFHEHMATSLALTDDITPQPDPDPAHLNALRALVISPDKLKEQGYVLDALTDKDLERKKRCTGCGKTMGSLVRSRNKPSFKPKPGDRGAAQESPNKPSAAGPSTTESNTTQPATFPPTKPTLRCRFHAGALVTASSLAGSSSTSKRKKVWTCCYKPATSEPCSGAEQHVAAFYPPGQIQREWQYHGTPTHKRLYSDEVRPAVALDCEMGTAKNGDSELIRVTLVDYFTDKVLIDNLVFPDAPMLHLNTKYSGVTWDELNRARWARTCFFGRDRAREAVWRFVGPETVVVGHSANNDLKALRWMHEVVVDTFLLEALRPKVKEAEKKAIENEAKEQGKELQEQDRPNLFAIAEHAAARHCLSSEESIAAPSSQPTSSSATTTNTLSTGPDAATGSQEPEKKQSRGSSAMSLKSLAKSKLGREIQNAGKHGHDSLEDALATRDLARWVVVAGIEE